MFEFFAHSNFASAQESSTGEKFCGDWEFVYTLEVYTNWAPRQLRTERDLVQTIRGAKSTPNNVSVCAQKKLKQKIAVRELETTRKAMEPHERKSRTGKVNTGDRYVAVVPPKEEPNWNKTNKLSKTGRPPVAVVAAGCPCSTSTAAKSRAPERERASILA